MSDCCELPNKPKPNFLKTYRPLMLIFLYICGFVIYKNSPQWNDHEAMADFMGAFFIVFSFFKFLNLSAFADAYATYDVIAKRSRAYAFIYPFLELGLGIAYITRLAPQTTNLITVILMGVSTIGVLQAVMKKSKIQCACLGTVFNLPMTTVTIVEDLLMVGMALLSLIRP